MVLFFSLQCEKQRDDTVQYHRRSLSAHADVVGHPTVTCYPVPPTKPAPHYPSLRGISHCRTPPERWLLLSRSIFSKTAGLMPPNIGLLERSRRDMSLNRRALSTVQSLAYACSQHTVVSEGNRFLDRHGARTPPPNDATFVLSPLGGERLGAFFFGCLTDQSASPPGRSGRTLRYSCSLGRSWCRLGR